MSDAGFSRRDRLASTLRQALAGPVSDLAREEGLGLVSVTRITIAPDLRRATVFISHYGSDATTTAVLASLKDHAPALQHAMASQMRTKRTPVLSFRADAGMAQDERISRLLHDHDPASDGGD